MDKETYTQWVIEQLATLGTVTSKKMFGGVGFFLDGLMFAKLSGDATLFFRVDDTNRADYERIGAEPFHSESKKKGMPYYVVPEETIEDRAQLVHWARKAHGVAVAHKK